MNILTDSPLLIDSPLNEQAKNVAIGQSFASSFLSGFNRGIERKREDERWAELKPLRDAQLAAQQAQVDAAKSQAQLQAIQLAKESMMKSKMAEFAALDAELAFQGYTPEAKVNMLGWMEKNSEFYGSRFHADLEQKFTKAAMAAADKEKMLATFEKEKEVARIREGGSGTTIPSDELIRLRNLEDFELNAILKDPKYEFNEEARKNAADKVIKHYSDEREKLKIKYSGRVNSGETAVLDPAPPGDGSVERIELDENGNVRVVNPGQLPKADDGSGAPNASPKAPPVSSVRKDYSRAIVNPAKDTDADIIFKILGDRGIQDDESRRRIMQYLK